MLILKVLVLILVSGLFWCKMFFEEYGYWFEVIFLDDVVECGICLGELLLELVVCLVW